MTPNNSLISKLHNKSVLYRIICVLLTVVLLISTFMSGTFTWYQFLGKTNQFIGIGNYSVELIKLAKDVDGQPTEETVENAEFYLYKDNGDDAVTQIGGRFTTDEDGKITVGSLESGNYYFLETNPSYGFEYDKDEEDKEVTKYHFTISNETANEERKVEVTAYNQRQYGDLSITKTLKNFDDSALTEEQKEISFAFTVTFSDEGTYKYKIDDEELQTIKSGETIFLKDGQTAVIENLPVGVTYKVTEIPTEGYSINSNGHQGTITSKGAEANFVNTVLDGKGILEIKKTVAGDGAQTDFPFRFTVTFDDGGSYSYRVNNGIPILLKSGEQLELKHGETAVFDGLPVGLTYKVEEDSYLEYDYISSAKYYIGRIIKNKTTLPFINYKDNGEEDTGSLTFSKEVIADKVTEDQLFLFTVTFSEDGTYIYSIDNGELISMENGGTVALKHGETVVFKDLPKGITYKVVEEDCKDEGYTAALEEVGGTVLPGDLVNIAFVNVKDDVFAELTVKKIVDGKVPEADEEKEFEFTVIINGKETVFSLKADEERTFELPVGAVYEVYEKDYFDEGYIQTSVTSGYGTADEAHINVTVTNRYINTIMLDIEGEKTWEIPENANLPDEIYVNLMTGSTVVESAVVKPAEDGSWKYKFSVPKYGADGETEILYTVEEVAIESFKSTVDGYDIKNTYIEPVDFTPAVEKQVQGDIPETTAEFNFMIEAIDSANMPQDSENGIKSVTVNGAGTVDFGKITYKSEGIYQYKITEQMGSEVGYTYDTSEYILTVEVIESNNSLSVKSAVYEKADTVANSAVFVNYYDKSHNTVTVSGQKVWQHNTNPEENWPESILVYIKNGDEIVAQIAVTEKSNWTWEATLPKYDSAGEEIDYTVDEEMVPGYKKSISGNMNDGFTITNAFETDTEEYVSVNVIKKWIGDNPDQPEKVNVQLYKDGKAHGDPVMLNKDSNWSYEWEKLPASSVWTVDEIDKLEEYTKTISGDVESGFVITNKWNDDPKPSDDTVIVSGTKTWNHGSNTNKPNSITICVLDGTYVVKQKVITADDSWSWSFELPKYDSNGEVIKYTVDELDVTNYTKTITGYNIKNTYTPGSGGNTPGNGKGQYTGGTGTSPTTGDISNPWLWFTLMVISACVLRFVMYRKRLSTSVSGSNKRYRYKT